MARARSRKRRPTGAKRAATSIARRPDSPAKARDAAGAIRREKVRTSPTASTYGERPRAPWHPLPLSELLILVGAVGAAIGLKKVGKGLSSGGPALFAGIAAVAIGTIEVTLREHRSGYRSHTMMLALLVVLVFHTAVVLGLSSVTTVPRLLNVGLLAVDVALFAFLFKLLRARFLDARHARVLREG
ncbi:MAG: hypothetical protein ACRDLF_04765 [Solirubrobacteraceae bacterium]